MSDHSMLSWDIFTNEMMSRYRSESMRYKKQEELRYPKVEGSIVLERVTKFNQLLQYAGTEVSSEAQRIRRFHKWVELYGEINSSNPITP